MKFCSTSLVSLSLLGLLAACGDLATPTDPNTPGGTSHPGASGDGNPDNSNGGSTGSNAGTGSTSTGRAGNAGSGGVQQDDMLSVTSIDAQVVGRDGNQIQFTVSGTRPASGVYSIAVSFEDGSGAPVVAFDSDFDAVPDSADGRIVFDTPVLTDTFTATATLSGIQDATKLVKAKVSLVDTADIFTNPVEVVIGTQKLLALGDACDPKLVTSRCDAGQSCSGTPSKCIAGVAATLAEVKYLTGTTAAPTILVRGTDPDDDMGSFHVEFLDTSNKPVTVDPDTTPATSYDSPAASLSSGGTFFGLITPGLTLETLVPRVRITPLDSLGHMGQPLSANLMDMTRANDGTFCDPRGFSGCMDGSVCASAGSPTSGKCAKGANARATACTAAPKLSPAAGVTSLAGRLSGGSLWEPPDGCTGPENVGRPEAAIALHLSSTASTLTISTERPETHTDTVLYLVPSCGATAQADWCHDDDDGGFASKLVLSNVAAGDYTIIVEYGHLGDGEFGVSVDAQ